MQSYHNQANEIKTQPLLKNISYTNEMTENKQPKQVDRPATKVSYYALLKN